MTIFPIKESYWDERTEETVDTGVVIGYQAIGSDGTILGEGETIADAEEAAIIAIYSESGKSLTNRKRGRMLDDKKLIKAY